MNKQLIAAISIVLLLVCVAAASESAVNTTEETQGIFSGTFADALWTVIAFGTLVIVLGLVAWKPLLRNLHAREAHIKKQLDDADAAKSEAENLLAQYKQQSNKIIEQANSYANQTSKEIIEQARKEALSITERAKSEITNAQTAASQQLWHMAGNMLIAISHEVLGRTITPEDNKRLIHEAIGKLQEESLNK